MGSKGSIASSSTQIKGDGDGGDTGFVSSSSQIESAAGENEDIYVLGQPIPPEILTEILIRIDSSHDVGYVCPLVCHRWYNILCAPGFWISYMEYRSMTLPPSSIRSEPSLNIKKVCLKQSFGRNLIANPSGEKTFDGWTISEDGGDGFKIEQPPDGCTACLEDDITVAFATSFGWCRKHYIVDLFEKGIEAFLDEYRPPITVSEFYNCRYDCASTYFLKVDLILNDQPSAARNTAARFLPRRIFARRQIYREGLRFGIPNPRLQNDRTTSTFITRIRTMEQWTGAEWQKIEHTFTDYPPGIRYVVFEHAGKDDQFWAGHYGSKMARASVVVNFGNGEKKNVS